MRQAQPSREHTPWTVHAKRTDRLARGTRKWKPHDLNPRRKDCVHRDRPIKRDNHHRGPPLEGLRAELGVTAGVAPQLDRADHRDLPQSSAMSRREERDGQVRGWTRGAPGCP